MPAKLAPLRARRGLRAAIFSGRLKVMLAPRLRAGTTRGWAVGLRWLTEPPSYRHHPTPPHTHPRKSRAEPPLHAHPSVASLEPPVLPSPVPPLFSPNATHRHESSWPCYFRSPRSPKNSQPQTQTRTQKTKVFSGYCGAHGCICPVPSFLGSPILDTTG